MLQMSNPGDQTDHWKNFSWLSDGDFTTKHLIFISIRPNIKSAGTQWTDVEDGEIIEYDLKKDPIQLKTDISCDYYECNPLVSYLCFKLYQYLIMAPIFWTCRRSWVLSNSDLYHLKLERSKIISLCSYALKKNEKITHSSTLNLD
jgi:hypothetical protein